MRIQLLKNKTHEAFVLGGLPKEASEKQAAIERLKKRYPKFDFDDAVEVDEKAEAEKQEATLKEAQEKQRQYLESDEGKAAIKKAAEAAKRKDGLADEIGALKIEVADLRKLAERVTKSNNGNNGNNPA